MLELPFPLDTIRLADWLELQTIITDDHSTSAGELERVLHREGKANAERRPYEAITEIELRARSAGAAYPFAVSQGVVTLVNQQPFTSHLSYLFCLCLSYFGYEQKKGSPHRPRRWFEELSVLAAQAFLSGQSALVSPPRFDLPKLFKGAIGEVCARVAEGGGWRDQPPGWNRRGAGVAPQDDAVDVVAWRHFPDKQSGKLVLFGQCASGDNWETKLTELQPDAFCGQWMSESPPSKILRALFIPHRIPRERWDRSTRLAGVIFDRCRIAHYSDANAAIPNATKMCAWCIKTLKDGTVSQAA